VSSYNRQLLPIDTNHYALNKQPGPADKECPSSSSTPIYNYNNQMYYGCRRQATIGYPATSSLIDTNTDFSAQHVYNMPANDSSTIETNRYDFYSSASYPTASLVFNGENTFNDGSGHHLAPKLDLKAENESVAPSHRDEFDTDSNSNTSINISMLKRSHSVLSDYYNCK
jgi:hypothetical protein